MGNIIKDHFDRERAAEVLSPEHTAYIAEFRDRIKTEAVYPDSLLEKVRTTRILVGGVGSVGGNIARQLVRFGAEYLHLVDPDTPEIHNLPRQVANMDDVITRRTKVDSFYRDATEINPYVSITKEHGGVTKENAHELVSNAEIIIDGVDIDGLEGIVALHEEACLQRKVVVTAFDLGGQAFVRVFDYKNKLRKPFGGLVDEMMPQIDKALIALDRGIITKETYKKLVNGFNLALIDPLMLTVEELRIFSTLKPNDPHPQFPATANLLGALTTTAIIEIIRGNPDVRDVIQVDLFGAVLKRGLAPKLEKAKLLLEGLASVKKGKEETLAILANIEAQLQS